HVMQQRPEQAVAALETIRDASKEALRELRGILNVLRQVDEGDERSPAPGLADLGALVEATSQAGLQVTFITRGQPRQLPGTVELAAYRIVQESLTNALRYAHGGSAEVKLVIETGCLTVEIDNTAGTGTELIAGSGQGILGMRERAVAVGGRLEARPRADGGFRVCAILPLQP
ncbi:MAG: sensor histidine kinase, partial [Chloroflexi bacterium]|nr:sensor histidine kinase [Chloroflexota bacterium]